VLADLEAAEPRRRPFADANTLIVTRSITTRLIANHGVLVRISRTKTPWFTGQMARDFSLTGAATT
jgi:hypothetical protein